MKGSTLGAAAARRRRRRLVATSDLLNDPDQQAAAATAEDLPAEPGESRFSREQAAEPAAANR